MKNCKETRIAQFLIKIKERIPEFTSMFGVLLLSLCMFIHHVYSLLSLCIITCMLNVYSGDPNSAALLHYIFLHLVFTLEHNFQVFLLVFPLTLFLDFSDLSISSPYPGFGEWVAPPEGVKYVVRD